MRSSKVVRTFAQEWLQVDRQTLEYQSLNIVVGRHTLATALSTPSFCTVVLCLLMLEGS